VRDENIGNIGVIAPKNWEKLGKIGVSSFYSCYKPLFGLTLGKLTSFIFLDGPAVLQ
jgi:hypothetical protein